VAGCQQEPAVGSTLSLAGNLFSTTALTIITPSPSSTAAPYSSGSGSTSVGTTIGATVGTLVFVLGTLGFCIICWGKRRRRAELQRISKRTAEVVESSSGQALVEPKWKQKSPMSASQWSPDESPSTAGGWGSETTAYGFSPYSSKYGSPVSARDALNPKQTWEWTGVRGVVGPAAPPPVEKRNFSPYTSPSSAHDAQGPKQDWDRAEAIELARVPAAGRKSGSVGGDDDAASQQGGEGGLSTAPVIKIPDRGKGRAI
jgi:hypothetical protein